MKITFFGSDDFAVKSLEALMGARHDVAACVTQPDMPRDRGLKVTASPVKIKALECHMPVLQPVGLKDKSFITQLRNYNSDVFVVVAYGKILPDEILKIPRICAVNVHGSLLPKYRGAAPVNWAIINGETETGISIIRINECMDAGDILAQVKVRIEKKDTAVTLREKMAETGADCLCQTIDSMRRHALQSISTAQNNKDATFAPKLTKDLGLIAWKKSAAEIHNLVRGLLPWPAAYTYYNGKLLKILETEVIAADPSRKAPGVVADISKNGLIVSTGRGDILIKKVHLQSANPMDAGSFVAGHKIMAGYHFGKKDPSS